MTDERSETERPTEDPMRRVRLGLSGKLLLLTVLFVMLAEVLIYVPSIANFRLAWLSDRIAAAHTAALVLDAAPDGLISDDLTRQLLDSVGAKSVAMKKGDSPAARIFRDAAEDRSRGGPSQYLHLPVDRGRVRNPVQCGAV